MISRGLLVRLEARSGKEADVEAFLRSALPLVQREAGTTAWFAVRFGRGEYGIFDVFPDDESRDAHLGGPVAKGLEQRGDEEQSLRDAQPVVMDEPRTTAWFAIHTDAGEYGIFDVFPDNGGRFAHLAGGVPRELAKHALTLLGSMPDLEMLNVEAEKLAA